MALPVVKLMASTWTIFWFSELGNAKVSERALHLGLRHPLQTYGNATQVNSQCQKWICSRVWENVSCWFTMKFGIWWVQNGKHQKAPDTAAKKNLCCWTKGGFTLPTSVPTSDASEGLVGFHHLEDLELQRGPVQWHCWDPDVHIWYYTYVCCVCKMWRCIYTYVQLYLKYICIIHVCVCGICTYILYHCSIHMCVLATLCILYIYACVCKQLVVCSSDPYVCRLQQKTTVLVHILGLSENKVLKPYGFSSSSPF